MATSEYKLQLNPQDRQIILEALRDADIAYHGPAFCSPPAADDAKADRIYDVWTRVFDHFEAQKPEDQT